MTPKERIKLALGIEVEPASPEDHRYNCAAFAAGYTNVWMESDIPLKNAFWPVGAQTGDTVTALQSAYEVMRFEPCGLDGNMEANTDKLAIFEKDGEWVHVARQVGPSMWASKLTFVEDVVTTLEDLQPRYGKPVLFMRKRHA